jgi:hypothetical protein
VESKKDYDNGQRPADLKPPVAVPVFGTCVRWPSHQDESEHRLPGNKERSQNPECYGKVMINQPSLDRSSGREPQRMNNKQVETAQRNDYQRDAERNRHYVFFCSPVPFFTSLRNS